MKTRIRQLTEQEKRSLGEKQMLSDWMKIFPNGILSVVSDTFDLWKLITEYLPALKEEIMDRDGKLVIRPDSGDPVDIICGLETPTNKEEFESYSHRPTTPQNKGVIELLWDIFGGTINDQGYKVLDPHIGAIYGDSITTERQVQMYKRLAAKGFASTNIVLGVGSFTYQFNTRDTFGFAAKGAWFEVKEEFEDIDHHGKFWMNDRKVGHNIFKDPVTDDGTKKSLKGFQYVVFNTDGTYEVISEVTEDKAYSEFNLLKTIYKNGKFFNQTTLTEIRARLEK